MQITALAAEQRLTGCGRSIAGGVSGNISFNP